MRPKKRQSNMTLKTSITNQNSPFLMGGGGNYSEEVIGDSEEVFCERDIRLGCNVLDNG